MFLTRRSRNSIGLFAAVLVAFLFVPGSAHALTLEYYAYGGFADVVHGFTKCALIFSDSVYKSLFPTVFVLSLATALLDAGIYSILTEIRAGGVQIAKSEGVYSAFVNAMIGTALFIGLMVPKGELQIHDPNTGSTQLVGNIPLLAVITAGAGNLVQRAIVQVVETAGDPLGYSKQSGMKSMQVINSIMNRSDSEPETLPHMSSNLKSYYDDCVSLAVTQPETGLTIYELMVTTPNLMVSLGKAASPGNFTTIFNDLNPQGTGGTCAASYVVISVIPTPKIAFKSTIEQACADANYKVYDAAKGPAELAACIDSTDALLQAISPGMGLDTFVTQMYQANLAYLSLVKQMPTAVREKETSSYNRQSLLTYFRTMGQKQGMVAAFGAMMLPFFGLLLPTKFWSKAVGGIVFFFLIGPVWGIFDAIASDFYLSRAVEGWAGVLNNGKGINNVNLWGSGILSDMSTWGAYVVATFGLALTATKMISGGVGSAMGHMGDTARAAAEGRVEMGKAGTDAGSAGRVSTGAGLSEANVMAAHARAGNIAMGNGYSASTQGTFEGAANSGTYDGNAGIMGRVGANGVRAANSKTTQGTFAQNAGVGQGQANAGFGNVQANGAVQTEATQAGQTAVTQTGVNAGQLGRDQNSPQIAAAKDIAGRGETAISDSQRSADINRIKTQEAAKKNVLDHKAAQAMGFAGDIREYNKATQGSGQLKMKDKFSGEDGTMSISTGADGKSVASSTFHGDGHTGTAQYNNAQLTSAKTNSGDAWGTTWDSGGNVQYAYNKAIQGGISQDATAKVSESIAESFKNDAVFARQEGTATEHSAATQQTNSRIKSWSNEMGTTIAEQLVKSGAIKQTEQAAAELAISGSISLDTLKAAGFMAGMLGGPAGAGFGAATAGLASLAGKAIGLKTEVKGAVAATSSRGTAHESAVTNTKTQAVQSALKSAVAENSTNSSTLADIKKGSISNTSTTSDGHSRNYGNTHTFDSSKGFTMRAEMETGFIKEQSESPKFATKADGTQRTEIERNAAAQNYISNPNNRDAVAKDFGAYLEKKQAEDPAISAEKAKIATEKAALVTSNATAQATVGRQAQAGAASAHGPGPTVWMTMAEQVNDSVAQANTNISAEKAKIAAGAASAHGPGPTVWRTMAEQVNDSVAQANTNIAAGTQTAKPDSAQPKPAASTPSAAQPKAKPAQAKPAQPQPMPAASTPSAAQPKAEPAQAKPAQPQPMPAASTPSTAQPKAEPAHATPAPVQSMPAAAPTQAVAPEQVVIENTTQVEGRHGGGGVQMPNYVAPDLQSNGGGTSGGGQAKGKPSSAPSVDGSSTRPGKSGPPKID